MKSAGRCYVYVIGPEAGPFKIGLSHNVERRLYDLQVGSPVRLLLMWKQRFQDRMDASTVEASLHRSLASFWCHGEWFKMSAEDAILAVKKFENTRRTRPIDDAMAMILKYSAGAYADPADLDDSARYWEDRFVTSINPDRAN
jgi:hypothetical protein